MDNFRDSYFQVDWDLTSKRLKGTYWGKQYDTGRGFTVTVINGGQVVTPTTEVLRLKWEKPDNTTGYVNATIVDGKFIVENIDQMFTVQGSVRADFELSVAGESLASITFYVSVEKAVAVDAIESSSDFTALQTALNDINAAIAGATVDSEVILARGTEATLGARLDSTDAQLAETDQRIDHLVPVTNDKIRTFKKGKNLFNPFTLNVGVVPSQATGELSNQNPDYSTSDYTEVTANTTYTLKSKGIVCFYKSDYSFISANSGSVSPHTFTTPNETNFIRHSVWNGSINTQQLEVGAVSTTYEPYRIYSKELDMPTMDLKPTTTEIEYENGRVSKVTEKLGDQIIKTTTPVYSSGVIQSVIEKTDDFSATSTIIRAGNRISGISKTVSKI